MIKKKQALNCSCFIPVWSGNHYSTYKGVKHIDGGFSDNLPVFDEHTIRVCCFSGATDISPYDKSRKEMLSGTVLNTPLYFTFANFRRGKKALFPPPASYILQLLELGFQDTKRFILDNDLIQCDSCWNKTDFTERQIYQQISPSITPAISRANSRLNLNELHLSSSNNNNYNSNDENNNNNQFFERSPAKKSNNFLYAENDDNNNNCKRSSFNRLLSSKLKSYTKSKPKEEEEEDNNNKCKRKHCEHDDDFNNNNVCLAAPIIVIEDSANCSANSRSGLTSDNNSRQMSPTSAKTSSPYASTPSPTFESFKLEGSAEEGAKESQNNLSADKDSGLEEPINELVGERAAPKISVGQKAFQARRNTLLNLDNNDLNNLLVLKDKFTLAAEPLPSCPPSPNLNRHCTKCMTMRQEARMDLLEEEIRIEAEKYKPQKEYKDGGLKNKIINPIRWIKQLGVKTSYKFESGASS